MKKNFIKFMALMAVALPMAFLSSCSDDDDNNNNNNNNNEDIENTEQTIKDVEIKMDGEDFVKRNWLSYDENGNVIGVAVGKAINEAEPTVVYVGVENLRDAIVHFNIAVKPNNATKKVVNGNWHVILVDTLGNEQNIIHFDKVDDGEVLAKVYLDKNIGIERYITEIRYIPTSLWPENAIGGNSPFRIGCVYTFSGKNYVCLRSNAYGQDGLLVSDVNHKQEIGSVSKWQSEKFTSGYPNLNTCKEICKELSNTVSGSRFWQLLCASAGQTDMKKFKTREYWTSTTSSDDICVINLASNSDGKFVDAEYGWILPFGIKIDGTQYWELFVYRFKVNEKGVFTVWKSNDGIWKDTDYYKDPNPTPNASEFVRNEKLEQDSEKISLQ